MKKQRFFELILVLICFLFTSCGAGLEQANRTPVAVTTPETVEISFTGQEQATALVEQAKFDSKSWQLTNVLDGQIKANIPSGKVSIDLLPVENPVTVDKLAIELDAKGYRPATLLEIVMIAVQHPELQMKYPIFSPVKVQIKDYDCLMPYIDKYIEYGKEKRVLGSKSCSPYSGPLKTKTHWRIAVVKK